MKEQLIAVLYDRKDALQFLQELPKVSKILTLTPDARATLIGIVIDIPIITSMDVYGDFGHRRVLARVRRMERKLYPLLELESGLSMSGKETFRGLIHPLASTATRIHITLKGNGPWLILSERKFEIYRDLKSAYRKIFYRIMSSYNERRIISTRNSLLTMIARKANQWVASYCSSFRPVLFVAYQYGNKYLASEIEKPPYNQANLSIVGHSDCIRALVIPIITLFSFFKGKKTGRLVAIPILNPNVGRVTANLLETISDEVLRVGFDIFKEKVVDAVVYTEGLHQDVQLLMQIASPKVVVAHALRWFEDAVVGEVAKKLAIPCKLLSHGSHPVPDTITARYEHGELARGLLMSSFASTNYLQSPHATSAFSIYGGSMPNKAIKPVMWGYKTAVATFSDKKERIILHAGTYKKWRTRPWIYETSDEFVAGLIHLVEVIEKIPNTKLIIRIRTAPECSLETLKTLLPSGNHYEIKSTGNFLDDLTSADLLVSFSSTTIEEALQARKPVLLWGGSQRYHHLKAQTKPPVSSNRSAVYAPKSPEELPKMIDSILNVHKNSILSDSEVKDHVWPNSVMNGADFVRELTS